MGLKKSKKLLVNKKAKTKLKSKNKPSVGKSINSASKVGKTLLNVADRYLPVSESLELSVGKSISNVFSKEKLTSKKRRKGKIPKQVKRWASRIVSRRKQEEKLVKELFGTGGGKVVKAPKKGSAGVITREEALRSLRN